MTRYRKFSTSGLLGAATAAGVSAILTGCLQTTPVVATQEQSSHMVYSCPGGRTLDVTRLNDQGSVVVVADGSSVRLNRDASAAAEQRYSNRLQTLTLHNNNDVTYESLGRTTYGRCTPNDGYSRDGNKRTKQENSD